MFVSFLKKENLAVIKKKIWPEYFELVLSGKKKFELRLNDFEVNEDTGG